MPDLRVLVVDDHPVVRRGLADLLGEELGIVVVGQAATIAEAAALAADAKPHVAIVDLYLGAEDGLSLVADFARSRPPIPCLVLSSHDEWLHADRAIAAGAKGFVMKDKGGSVLVAAVRRVADGKVYLSPTATDRVLQSMGTARVSERSPLARLSPRERQVLDLLGRGMTAREAATQLRLSVKTVETHVAHLKDKLGASSGRELMRLAFSMAERS